MLLLQDEQVIETRATHASQKTFTDGIGARSVRGCFQYLDAAACGYARETGSELGITITDEILRPSSISSRLPSLLGSPSVGRGTCDADVDHSPRVEFDKEEGEKRTEAKISDWEARRKPRCLWHGSAGRWPRSVLAAWWDARLSCTSQWCGRHTWMPSESAFTPDPLCSEDGDCPLPSPDSRRESPGRVLA